jgi:hypothetical protein
MESKIDDLETKIDDLETNIKTDLTDKVDMMIYKTDHMTKKVESKIDRYEAMLRRILGFGQTLQSMLVLEQQIGYAVNDMHQWGKASLEEEDEKSDSETESRPGEESILGENQISATGPGSGTESGPEAKMTSARTEPQDLATAVSPDVTMTTATPVNSQDDQQITTTIVPTPPPENPAGYLIPPAAMKGPDLLPPATIADPDLLNPPNLAGHDLSASPTAALTVLPTPSMVAATVHPHNKEVKPTGKSSRGRTQIIGDRRSPRLLETSRAPSPAAGKTSKRPSENPEEGDPKRQKIMPS